MWNAMRTVACHFPDRYLSDDIIDLKTEVEVVRCHFVPMMSFETLWSRVCGFRSLPLHGILHCPSRRQGLGLKRRC